jgi:hypothetical protein
MCCSTGGYGSPCGRRRGSRYTPSLCWLHLLGPLTCGYVGTATFNDYSKHQRGQRHSTSRIETAASIRVRTSTGRKAPVILPVGIKYQVPASSGHLFGGHPAKCCTARGPSNVVLAQHLLGHQVRYEPLRSKSSVIPLLHSSALRRGLWPRVRLDPDARCCPMPR